MRLKLQKNRKCVPVLTAWPWPRRAGDRFQSSIARSKKDRWRMETGEEGLEVGRGMEKRDGEGRMEG